MTNTEENKKQWAVVVQYECRLGERGTIVSWHKAQDLAEKACKRTGFDSFLTVTHQDDLF